jgi:hypothetical protein
MSDPLCIRVMFRGPNGEMTEGPEIVPSEEPPRQFDDKASDKNQCIHEFRGFLERRDSHGLEAAMRALDRLNCWREAFSQLMTGTSPNEAVGRALLSFWISYGFHIASSLQGDLILVDAFKYLLPPYSGPALKLYRGELRSRHMERIYGISWTPKLSVARMFADRRRDIEGFGVTLEIEATPEMIAASPGEHTSWLGEEEYVIDPRLIQAVRVLD